MTSLRGVLALGLGTLVAAWALGSDALAVAALGLLGAAVLALAWRRLVARSLRVEVVVGADTLVEGDPLRLEVRPRTGRLLPAALTLRQPLGRLGTRRVPLRRRRPTVVTVPSVPRGRLTVESGVLVVEDPLGLARVDVPTAPGPTLLVRPRIPLVDDLFLDGGVRGAGGRRGSVRSIAGHEPHGVREYHEGEPLRSVHWASTARRGRLMVRELDDTPRDDTAVVLDLDRSGEAGPVGATSLDEAVRAAGAIVRARVARGRRVALVLAATEPLLVRVGTLGAEWDDALDALAAAEAVPAASTASLLGPGSTMLAQVGEVVLVTARPERRVLDALAARTGLRAVVAVDAPTYAGSRPTRADPGLLALAASGAAVAVLRAGDDLRVALTRSADERVASG